MWLNSIFEKESDELPEIETLRELVRDVDRIRHQLNEDVAFDSHETQVCRNTHLCLTLPLDSAHLLPRRFIPLHTPLRLVCRIRWKAETYRIVLHESRLERRLFLASSVLIVSKEMEGSCDCLLKTLPGKKKSSKLMYRL